MAYRLEGLPITLTEKRRTVGFLGFCNYHCEKTASDYTKRTHTLCRFAEYGNVGGNRSSGFGVVRFIPKEEKTKGIKSYEGGMRRKADFSDKWL